MNVIPISHIEWSCQCQWRAAWMEALTRMRLGAAYWMAIPSLDRCAVVVYWILEVFSLCEATYSAPPFCGWKPSLRVWFCKVVILIQEYSVPCFRHRADPRICNSASCALSLVIRGTLLHAFGDFSQVVAAEHQLDRYIRQLTAKSCHSTRRGCNTRI